MTRSRVRYRRWASITTLMLLCVACGYDKSDRWLGFQSVEPEPVACVLGSERCDSERLERCESAEQGPTWLEIEDCKTRGQVCVPETLECKPCRPSHLSCDGQTILLCDENGETESVQGECDTTQGVACRTGSCQNLCAAAAARRSNVGCEYWAVDLDNANVGRSLNAAAQQFAVVVSNAEPDVPAHVTVEQDDTALGQPGAPVNVASVTVPPFDSRVFKLGPREVDGSPPGEFNTGTHTALTRAAYRIRSSVPVVVYQFNPLENVNVFSNDASVLKPVEALTLTPGTMTDSYVVLGWPQTVASTEDPNTNFDPLNPTNLRAFLSIVGTRPNTRVRVTTSTKVVGGGPVPETAAGGEIEATLEPFDVLNLETGGFNADFTGSFIAADQPIVVFSGSEASDAPYFDELSSRQCCADHLEEQLDPIRTAGTGFIAPVSSNRTRALAKAGADVGIVEQPEYFRVIAVTEVGARIKTTLGPEGPAELVLKSKGSYADMVSTRHFGLSSDAPVMLASISPSQGAAQVPTGLPGGDPSFLIIPPVEQYRSTYVFLVPDKYHFDFVRIVATTDTEVLFNRQPLAQGSVCTIEPATGTSVGRLFSPFVVHHCQLGFPVIDTSVSPPKIEAGLQNDGVHLIEANRPVGVLVDGFDSFVSYAYAGGTDLDLIVPE